jgi:Flp pilus assembly protein TadG
MSMIGKIKQGFSKRELDNHRKSKAQGMTEFALILPLLVALLFGVIEFGRMLFVYSVVYTASREGARYGSSAGNDNLAGVPNYIDCDGIRSATERLAILANVQQITIAYDEGSDSNGNPINRVVGCPNNNIEGGKHRIVVEVSAQYSTFIPLPSIPRNFTIQSDSARTIISDIVVGVYMPPGMYVDSMNYDSYPDGSRWGFYVDVYVKDSNNQPLDGATAIIKWDAQNNNHGVCQFTGIKGECACQPITDSDGFCRVYVNNIHHNITSKSFWVANITHPIHKLYNPTEGEFAGTAIRP